MILVNGAEGAASLSATDRGLQYGDGVFRTLAVRGGRPRHWSRQYRKLAADCAALAIACPDAALLEREAAHACSGVAEAALKIVITRGVSDRGYRYPDTIEPTRIVTSAPAPDYPAAYAQDGVRVHLCRLRFAAQPALAGVKHLNRLENVLARAEWSAADIAEGIVLDAHGNVVGGTMTNLFVSRGTEIATPLLDRCGVAGVTRERIIEAAARRGVACHVVRLSWDDIAAADEVVLVNSLAGAWPVCDLHGNPRKPGNMTRTIQRWLRQDDDADDDAPMA